MLKLSTHQNDIKILDLNTSYKIKICKVNTDRTTKRSCQPRYHGHAFKNHHKNIQISEEIKCVTRTISKLNLITLYGALYAIREPIFLPLVIKQASRNARD